MENEFEQSLLDTLASLGPLAAFGDFGDLPTTEADALNLTVGEYLDLLVFAEAALRDAQPLIAAQIGFITSTPGLDAETLSFLQDWAAGDFSFLTGAFNKLLK